MRTLLTTTAMGLIAAFAMPAQAQTTDEARVGGPCQQEWTVVDQNRDGKISESEAEAAINLEFARIDMNDNGIVSVKEWKDCAAPGAIPGGFQAAAETDAETVERGIGEAETAEPGDAAEETTAQADAPDQMAEATPENTGVAEPMTWTDEQFSEMDADESGDVSAEEAAEWSRSQAAAGQADEEAVRKQAARWTMLDTDGDGTVTQEEWEQRDQAAVEARFATIDQDGDGEVSESEWRQHREQRFEEAQSAAAEDVDLWLFYYSVI